MARLSRRDRPARLRAGLAAGAAALALALAPAAAASAHDYLVGSDPAAGSTVDTALDKVTLSFNDRVLDLSGDGRGTLVTVTGPGPAAKHFETGCAVVADTDVTAPVALGPAGTYLVTYQIVSADGHTVSDSLSFDYRPPAGAVESPGSDATPCGATATASPSGGAASTAAPSAPSTSGAVVSTAQPTTPGGGGDLGLVIGIAVAIVVLALLGVVIVVLTGRRGRAAGEAPPSDGASPDPSEDHTGSRD